MRKIDLRQGLDAIQVFDDNDLVVGQLEVTQVRDTGENMRNELLAQAL